MFKRCQFEIKLNEFCILIALVCVCAPYGCTAGVAVIMQFKYVYRTRVIFMTFTVHMHKIIIRLTFINTEFINGHVKFALNSNAHVSLNIENSRISLRYHPEIKNIFFY